MSSQQQPRSWKHDAGLGANLLVSFLLAPLPVAWRRPVTSRLDLDIDHAAILSSLAQLFLSLALWGLGYWVWFHGVDEELTAGARRLAESGGKYDQESYAIIGASALAMSPLLTIVYTLTTAVGFVTALATAGGLTRVIVAAATRENCPDPTLSALEWIRSVFMGRRAAKLRARDKGERSPDRLEMGDIASDGYDLRLTTQEELDWRVGNSIVVAGEPFFVIASSEVRDDEGRLRIRHDLRRLRVGEIVRAPRPYRPTTPPVIVTRPSP